MTPSFVSCSVARQKTRVEPAALLEELLASSLIAAEDWDGLPPSAREELLSCSDPTVLLSLLLQHALLTQYQAELVGAAQAHQLILDHYRVLDRLGHGSLGIVYKAEHVHMRRPVALKVVSLASDQAPCAMQRYYREMRAVSRLQHPNFATILDAGEISSPHPRAPVLHYLVMEYVPGLNLEEYVAVHGPFTATAASDLIHQVAAALTQAHAQHLVHRNIKPANVRVTPAGLAKLLDFDLARHWRLLQAETRQPGTLEYVAPEQLRDDSLVDIRSDIFGLGNMLLWCLTGQPPSKRDQGSAVRGQTFPSDLERVITRMTAEDPENRYQTPGEVMDALRPFLNEGRGARDQGRDTSELLFPRPSPLAPGPSSWPLAMLPESGSCLRPSHQVLIVDDELDIRNLCRFVLEPHQIHCDEAADGPQALRLIAAKQYDLILLDMAMPGMNGGEVCQKLRQNPPTANLKIILFSGHLVSDDLAHMLSTGADDFVTKPFSLVQLLARIKAALRLKEAQDRADQLRNLLLGINHQLELNLHARDRDLVDAHKGLVLALAKLVECRDTETGTHLKRMQYYCRLLAQEVSHLAAFAGTIDADFIRSLEWCAPLHDIGKAGIPDSILQKPGLLTPQERAVMQTHTILGCDTLKEVARQHGSGMAFLQMAIDVARYHHERYDGTGYPDQLSGNAIPLAARILAVADVYDALRSRRVYKPALSHPAALQVMLDGSDGQFDPAVLQAFQCCAAEFDRIFTECAD
jgi:response regulator RpfG family c-di-GMP phosphodiesterase